MCANAHSDKCCKKTVGCNEPKWHKFDPFVDVVDFNLTALLLEACVGPIQLFAQQDEADFEAARAAFRAGGKAQHIHWEETRRIPDEEEITLIRQMAEPGRKPAWRQPFVQSGKAKCFNHKQAADEVERSFSKGDATTPRCTKGGK